MAQQVRLVDDQQGKPPALAVLGGDEGGGLGGEHGKKLLNGMPVDIPDNVLVTDWLPAHKVNPMADLSVIHGGLGTVMTACLSGTPIVGVGMHFEQEANLECVVRKGFGVRLRKRRFNSRDFAVRRKGSRVSRRPGRAIRAKRRAGRP